MKRKKLLFGVLLSLALALMLTGMSTSALADSHSHSEWTAWSDAANLPNAAGNYYLTTDVTYSSQWKPKGTTNLCLNGHTITYNSYDSAIMIDSGVTLNLHDCAGNGCITTTKNTTASPGGGVYVNGGAFTMYDGKISGFYVSNSSRDGAGGVYVYNGTFTMNGGTIDGTKAKKNGGGVYVYNGMFTMNGGTIANCTAGSNGAGVYVRGGAAFTMNGGTITNCTMESTSGSHGAGVYVAGTFIMNNDSKIKNCVGAVGGGVYVVDSGTFTMNSGSIEGCMANNTQYGSDFGGGGVFIYSGTFTMNNGTINNCKTDTQGNGGGVDIYTGTFDMKGGTITGCQCKKYGGGVYFPNNADAHFKVSGAPRVTNNRSSSYTATDDDVCMDYRKKIEIEATLSSSASVAVYYIYDPSSTLFPSQFTTGLNGKGDISSFSSNRSEFVVTKVGDDGEAYLGKAVTLTYNGGSGSGDPPAAPTGYVSGTSVTVLENTYTYPGYRFTHWKATGSDNGTYSPGSTLTITSNTTLTAQWELAPATAPTITNQPQDLALIVGYAQGSVSVAVSSASGHSISYQWYSNTSNTNSGGTMISGATSATYTIPTGKSAGTTEYYYCVVTAHRSDNGQSASVTSSACTVTVDALPTASVTYHANGATGGAVPEDSNTYASGDSVTVLGNTGSLVKTNYNFTGWNTQADGCGTHYDVGGTFTISADTTLYAEWTEQLPRFTGNDMTLTAVLKLTYYVKLPTSFDGTGARITFSMPHRTEVQTVNYADGTLSGDTIAFDCYVYAYEIGETITATFSYTEGGTAKTLTDSYSVKQYLQAVIADAKNDTDIRRAKALMNYGYFVKPYLQGVGTIGSGYGAIPDTYIATVTSGVETAQSGSVSACPAVSVTSNNAKKVYFLLNVNSGTDLAFEILPYADSDTYSATVDGKSVDKDVENGIYRIAKTGIAPNNLAVNYAFSLALGDTTVFSASVSPMYYINTVLNKSASDAELKALTALYQYWDATAHN